MLFSIFLNEHFKTPYYLNFPLYLFQLIVLLLLPINFIKGSLNTTKLKLIGFLINKFAHLFLYFFIHVIYSDLLAVLNIVFKAQKAFI